MKHLPLFYILFSVLSCEAQPVAFVSDEPEPGIIFHLNDNVENAKEDYAVAIVDLWQRYLDEPLNFLRPENEFWDRSRFAYPDNAYNQLLFGIIGARKAGAEVRCNILGVTPVSRGHYLLSSMFYKTADSTGITDLKFITTVYARKVDGNYRLVCSPQYLMEEYETRQVGSVNYLIHPTHGFQPEEALKMNLFNQEIAAKFNREPLAFDYVVANHTGDLSDIMGTDFNSYSFSANRSGGMADTYNNIIYAGNNSAYYPHEVVHLYTHATFPRQYHPWVDEGIAALFGGSTGYYIEWHWQKLKEFLAAHPEFPLEDLTTLQTDVPNGEYTTDFRYAIGGYLMKQVHEREGMSGLFEALASGRSEQDYFTMLETKLGFKRAEFEQYVRREMEKLSPLSETEMAKLRY